MFCSVSGPLHSPPDTDIEAAGTYLKGRCCTWARCRRYQAQLRIGNYRYLHLPACSVWTVDCGLTCAAERARCSMHTWPAGGIGEELFFCAFRVVLEDWRRSAVYLEMDICSASKNTSIACLS